MKLTMKVEGMRGLTAAFKAMPREAKTAGRAATRIALGPARQFIEGTAPVDTGLLRTQIRVNTASSRLMRQYRMSVGAVVGIAATTGRYVDSDTNRRAGRVGKRYQRAGPGHYGKYLEYGFTLRDGRRIDGILWLTHGFELARSHVLSLLVRSFGPRFERAVARTAARLKGRG